MRKSDLSTGAGRIRYALEHLETVWNESSAEWNDVVSRNFQEYHLEPMLPQIKLALDAISRMSLLINEVERDCES
jgi:hypothetical protein